MIMTWKEFKEKVEMAGVKDEDEMFYIDISNEFFSVERHTVDRPIDASGKPKFEFMLWDQI